MPPMRNRTNTHGDCSRQNTRLTRPDWPQNGLSSETIVTVHPQSATYGAVCRWLKRYDVGVRDGPNVIAVTPQDRRVHGLGKGQARGRGVHSAVCTSDVSSGDHRAMGVVSAAAKTGVFM